MVKGMGGAMDLVAGARRVVVIMEHTAKGAPRSSSDVPWPLTGERCVNRVITERCVLDVTPAGLQVVELLPGWTKEQVTESTEADASLVR